MTGPGHTRSADPLHAVLAGWLVRRDGCTPAQAVQDHGVEALLAACEREGVVSLVHARLSEAASISPVPPELMQPLAVRARTCAARNLLCVSEARRIQQALDAAGIPAIWLKGIALGLWLYPRAHLRDIADIDLLLPDHATTLRVAEALAPLGYALPNPHIAGDLVVHELLAWSERAQLELDLHWDLSNDALFAGRLEWNALRGDAVPLATLGQQARGLSSVHAFLHACMHRALNHLTRREDRLRWLYDIHLLWESMTAGEQAKAVALAREARLADACEGAVAASAEVFGTCLQPSLAADLQAASSRETLRTRRLRSWTYFQWATLRELGGTRKLRWLRQLALPGMSHLRVRYGAGSAGDARVLARRLSDAWRRWRAYVVG